LRKKPLLDILGLTLPDIGGEQGIRELKALGDVPVIMLTPKRRKMTALPVLPSVQPIMW